MNEIANSIPCKACEGSGEEKDKNNKSAFVIEMARDMGYPPNKCPTCTPRREALLAKAQALEWHECAIKFHTLKLPYLNLYLGREWKWCPDSGLCLPSEEWPNNPTFTIEPVEGYISIVESLKELGLWEEFALVEWNKFDRHQHPVLTIRRLYTEILTNAELLAQAVTSFLNQKGRE